MEETVTFNVGGKVFTTTRETVLREPDSLIAQMLDGRSPAMRDENGAYFIDHDPDSFSCVLEFLRTGRVFMTSGNGAGGDPNRMTSVSRFYQIPGMSGGTPATSITQLCALDEIVRNTIAILETVRGLTGQYQN